ncbi:MAG: acyltransferase, partial [Verrucomicrobia bacterium]|nr:acyltransferase [Verrucomicrobiota bacterium]
MKTPQAEMADRLNPPLLTRWRKWRKRRLNANMNRLLKAMPNVTIGVNNQFGAYANMCGLEGSAKLVIGDDNVFWADLRMGAYEKSTLHIGSGCGIVGGQIYARHHIRIGDRCLFGRNLVIEDYFGHPIDPVWRRKQMDYYVEHLPNREPAASHTPLTDEERAFFKRFPFACMPPIVGDNCAPIEIGNNVWIGRNVAVQKGVTIGDNCVIAQGSIVTKSIPANHIAAGLP